MAVREGLPWRAAGKSNREEVTVMGVGKEARKEQGKRKKGYRELGGAEKVLLDLGEQCPQEDLHHIPGWEASAQCTTCFFYKDRRF